MILTFAVGVHRALRREASRIFFKEATNGGRCTVDGATVPAPDVELVGTEIPFCQVFVAFALKRVSMAWSHDSNTYNAVGNGITRPLIAILLGRIDDC